MTIDDQSLVVRAASLYLTLVLTAAAWIWRRPGKRRIGAAALAFCWNLPAVLLLDVAARQFGWWHFEARGGLLLDTPVDLWLAWACLWGVLPALAFPDQPLAIVAAVFLFIDVVLMPHGAPVIRLGPRWLHGEAVGVLSGLIPSQLLARWTAQDRRLGARALLQAAAFAGLFAFVLPAIVIEGTNGRWLTPFARPVWELSLIVQALAVPALIGLTAVQEFAARGGGTPVPFDPPRRLVTSGVYAYVRNPMQLSAVVLMVLLGLVLHNAWIAAAGVMAHVYALGFAGWDEDEDLRSRFGARWIEYRRGVRTWRPQWRPWQPPDLPPARLFVSERCGMCREVAQWFRHRGVRGLEIIPAESHPSGALRRITYCPNDGTLEVSGVEAIGRALEHIHFGFAFIGFALRAPGVHQVAQLLADASGAGPRVIPIRPPALH